MAGLNDSPGVLVGAETIPETIPHSAGGVADETIPVGLSGPAHNDHPMRHYDRTCPACNPGVKGTVGGDQHE